MIFWRKLERRRAQVGLAIAGLFLLLFLFAPAKSAGAADDFVVSIHADSATRHLRTDGGTVGEILESAGYQYTKDDLVEPNPETKLTGPVFNINIYRARPVVVVDGADRRVVNTPYSSSQLIAEAAGFTIYREDILELERVDDFVGAGIIGEQLKITRATPIVIDLYGRRIDHRTHADTVAQVLAEKNIILDAEDTLIPNHTAAITDGMTIQIIRVGKAVVVETKVVDYQTEVIWDDNLEFGNEIEVQAGANGEKVITYEIEYHNGKEVDRETLKTVVSVEPITRILRVGTKVSDRLDNKALGQTLAAAKGWTDAEWVCLHNLWEEESHWNHLAANPYSTAYGIPQFLDGTWAGTGYSKTSDPATQIQAGFVYIEGRYGTPCGAWSFFQTNNWY